MGLAASIRTDMKLGINGLGRIGKLSLWHHVSRKYFREVVVNVGRSVGTSMADILHYVERDSTYGHLGAFLHGYRGAVVIEAVDEDEGAVTIDGVRVRFLRRHRNPLDIAWAEHGVKIVVDTTGRFLDPTLPPAAPGGALRGHLESGVERVIVSAPFKLMDNQDHFPEDAVMTVMGVNGNDYDPRRHRLISNASCTTTCLAHMIKPLLNHFGARKILTASMATVHAATGSQQVLDRLPKTGAVDLRKNRSVMNNIILTTTGAAKALRYVLPDMGQIGFIAESVRIPTSTGSLIILVLNLQEDPEGTGVRRDLINDVYRRAAAADPNGYLHFSEKQSVSSDIIGQPKAAAIIEGHETHTRTAEVAIDLERVAGLEPETIAALKRTVIRVPITQAVIYGWYDNEMGGYVNLLGDRTVSIAEKM